MLVVGAVLLATLAPARGQTPPAQPAYGIVRPLVIHVTSCLLFPFSPYYRPGCQQDQVVRRRERYFNLAGDEQLDIAVRQLESYDGTHGLSTDLVRLTTVPLERDGRGFEQAPQSAEELAENELADQKLDRVQPGAGPSADFADLPRLVHFKSGQGKVLEVQVDVKNIASGEYRGILAAHITSKTGNSQVVPLPMTLRIKDYFPLPLMVLLIGIAVGLWVSSYVSRKKDIDELITQSDQLQRQVEIEPRFHETFRTRIENSLRNVLFDLRRNQIDQAQENLSAAFVLWDKWRLRPLEWAELYDEIEARVGHIEKMLPALGHDQRIVKIGDAFNEIRRTATNEDVKFDEAAAQVVTLSEQLDRFLRVQSEVEAITKNLDQIDESEREQFRQDLEQLQQELNGTALDDSDGFDRLTEATVGIRNGLQNLLRERGQEWIPGSPLATPRRRPHEGEQIKALRPVGQLVSAAQWATAAARSRFRFRFGSARSALWRRNAFNVIGYTVLMIVLAGSGFNELYSQNPVFGANGFSDYMTLFAWGFGAEATRSSFAQLMSSWGHPAAARAA